MIIETIVDDLILIKDISLALSSESRCVSFKIEDINIIFELVDMGPHQKDGSSYHVSKGDKEIKFQCYLFDDKNSKFGIIKKPTKIAKVNGEEIYTSFIFERKVKQPTYTLTINFFKKIKEESTSLMG